MKILAIDTSSKNASVAITEKEEKIIELNNMEEKTHSQKLMVMIDEALKNTQLSLDDIGLISCCVGPGSFTGVRIGIATAKAFSDSKKILLTGVNSLEGLAYNLKKEGYICSLIDAGHGNSYAGLFKIEKDENGILQTTYEKLSFLDLKDENGNINVTEKIIQFLEENQIFSNKTENEIYFVGDATKKYEDIIKEICDYKIKISNDDQDVTSGITIAKLGYNKYKNGKSGNSSILAPVYMRKSQAELALEQKNKESQNELKN